MYPFIRPLLFKMDAEKAHHIVLKGLHYLPNFCFKKPQVAQPVSALGQLFPHAIGLAAGFDKNGEHVQVLSQLGFSFIEVGTVTPRPQPGNPKPRLFRLPQAHALINRMGFNNAGVDVLISHIKKADYPGILGINIGKNQETALAKAHEDYIYCMQKVYPYASYISVNISSPNTRDLRQLQQKEYLEDLLSALSEEKHILSEKYQRSVPLVLKISPDEKDETLKQIAASVLKYRFAGIIATNTTCSREGVENLACAREEGGLSGEPLNHRSTVCLKLLKREVGDAITLIAAGGIHDLASAKEKLQAGAALLQVYTGLIYGGPKWLISIIEGLYYK